MTDGMKSTEFWLVLAVVILAGANGTEYVNIPWEQFMGLVGTIITYIGGRSFVKAAAAKKE